MRIVVGLLSLVVSIAPAAAQYATAAPAPAATTPAAAAPATPAATTPAPTAAAAPTEPAAPIYPPGTADFHVNGASTMAAAASRSPEQQKADEESQAAWQTRCQPAVVEDRNGVRRVRYAVRDCDLSPFNTAGGK